MVSQPRFRLVSAIAGLALCLLPKATAQMQPAAPTGLGGSSTAPTATSTPPAMTTPSAQETGTPPLAPAADPQGFFAPSSPNGANDPFAPADGGSSTGPEARPPVQGSAGRSRPQGVEPGATPAAFGSLRDFSSELGVRQLIEPNSPTFQPLSVSDFRLVLPLSGSRLGPQAFRLSAGTAELDASHRERFARALAAFPPTSSPALGQQSTRQRNGRLAWPAIQSLCPDSASRPGSTTDPACPG